MKIQIQLLSEYGTFEGEILTVTPEQYNEIISISRRYYDAGFEMTTQNGDFLIVPPDIVKKSILKVAIIQE